MTIIRIPNGYAVHDGRFYVGRDHYWSRLATVLPFDSVAAAQAYIESMR